MSYALLSLCFAGANDLLFKRYGGKRRSIGLLLSTAGAFWLLFFVGAGALSGSFRLDLVTLGIGSVAGAFSAGANLLLIEGMKGAGAAVGSTVYRLNLVFAALLSFLLLGEAVGALKAVGLALAALAVALFSLGGGLGTGALETSWRGLGVLLAASFLRACMGVSYKLAQSCGAEDMGFLAVGGAWWIVCGLAYAAVREKGVEIASSSLGYGALCGALICGIVLFLKLSVNSMDASVAIGVSQFSFMVTAPLAALFFGERMTKAQGLGIALAAVCIGIFCFSR